MREEISQKSDEEIASFVQSGQIDFFGVLIERYEAKIKRYAQKFLSEKEDIEDILQDIFIKAYKNIQSFNPKRKFSSWLYRIAHNELVNTLKKKKRKFWLSFDFDFDLFLPYSNNNFQPDIDKKKLIEEIDKSFDKLKPKYKEPLFLYYYENLSYQEISEILQIPVSTVGVRIKRAKEKIKKLIENQKNYE